MRIKFTNGYHYKREIVQIINYNPKLKKIIKCIKPDILMNYTTNGLYEIIINKRHHAFIIYNNECYEVEPLNHFEWIKEEAFRIYYENGLKYVHSKMLLEYYVELKRYINIEICYNNIRKKHILYMIHRNKK